LVVAITGASSAKRQRDGRSPAGVKWSFSALVARMPTALASELNGARWQAEYRATDVTRSGDLDTIRAVWRPAVSLDPGAAGMHRETAVHDVSLSALNAGARALARGAGGQRSLRRGS